MPPQARLPVWRASRPHATLFYAISNTQIGLRGVSFGNFLLKQVIETLGSELPNIRDYVTLSSLPGFATWLTQATHARPVRPSEGVVVAARPIQQMLHAREPAVARNRSITKPDAGSAQ